MEIQIAYCFRLISGTFNCRRKVRMIVADHHILCSHTDILQITLNHLKKRLFPNILVFAPKTHVVGLLYRLYSTINSVSTRTYEGQR